MTAVGLKHVSVTAGTTRIIEDLSLDLPKGKIVAVVGPNGAGKTTLLDAISGTAPGLGGTVEIGGVDQPLRPGYPRAGVGRVFQGSPLPETMSVGEILALVAGGRAAAEPLLKRFGLTPHETTFVAELSTGMRRIVDLAVATVDSPPVLLLDEPASGLAQSEIEHLADVLRHFRDTADTAIVLVEHDSWLVSQVADEIIVMEGGAVAERGTPAEILGASKVKRAKRMASPHDEHFEAALTAVDASAVQAPPLVRRELSTWTILRLGLREFAAGLASVLILGVLSRVLKVELGVSLGAVAVILATYNLAAPLGLPIGHWSDTKPIFGRRRVPYIIGGAIVTGGAVAAAPHVAGNLAGGITAGAVILSVMLFVAMGIGMYGAGTAFFALLSDMASPSERGHVAKVIYIELLAGVFLGVALTGALVEHGTASTGVLPDGIGTLFALAGLVIVVLSSIAVLGQERPTTAAEASAMAAQAPEHVPFRVVFREAARLPQARVFFTFMVSSTLFFFIQQAIVQPYGGDVFGMTVQQTSGLTAMLTLGTIVGMVVAGRPFAAQVGHRRIARWGLRFSVFTFAALALSAATTSVPGTWLSLLLVGFGLGVFNVATLALMMSMVTRARAAFFMGAWTVAHALADGASTAGGGLIYTAARALTGSPAGGYAIVFLVEAIGLALCLPLLRKVDPDRFIEEAAEAARAIADDQDPPASRQAAASNAARA